MVATRGFEFAYMLDGSQNVPVVKEFPLGTALARVPGDLMLLDSSGNLLPVTSTTTEVTGVCQETIAAAAISVGTTLAKTAIITREQVWRCSTDATSGTSVVGVHKTIDTVDHNTIDVDAEDVGAMILVSDDHLDNSGNVIFEVVFSDTTFGNA